MAYIAKHGDGWRAQVVRKGVRKSAVWPTKREASAWAARVELEIDGGQITRTDRTFAAARAHYLETVSTTKVDAVQWESRRLASMEAFFGAQTALSSIDSALVGKWRDMRLQTVSGSTVLREANLLRNLLKLAKDEWKWIDHEPFKGVRLPEESAARQTVWRWQQIRRVLRYCQAGGPKQQEVGRALHIALRTAMRLSEVLNAKLSGNVALLPKDKTTRALVKIPLTRHGIRLLGGPAFTVTANEASVLFSQACQACGVRVKGVDGVTFHDARATALTLLARKVDVMTLARISRHRDIRILQNTYFRETAEQIAVRIQEI
jgi:integrase